MSAWKPRYRRGRKNPHTLYLQIGEEPSDGDVPIGCVFVPDHADVLVSVANMGLELAQAQLRPGAPGSPEGGDPLAGGTG